MKIRRHKRCTQDLGAPRDISDGSCAALPVAVHQDQYGTWASSFWKPDADELEALLAGGSVVLQVRATSDREGGVVGASHPVVSVGVTTQPTEPA